MMPVEQMPASQPVLRPPPGEPRPVPPRRGRRLGVLPSLVVGALALLLWIVLSRSGLVSDFLLPPPEDVLRALWHAAADGLLWRYLRVTVVESLSGFALGAALALPLGYLTARSRLAARALEPYIAASQALPAVAVAPLLILWLGFGLAPIAVLCALIVFFPATVNTALGIRDIDPEVLAAARVDGAGAWALLWHIELPLALPTILAGLRTSLTLSITGAVVGEFVVGDRGLGGLMTIARGNFDTPLVFATLLTLAILATIYYLVARLCELWARRAFS
ncbi:MAG TPA: ABC transporter permease [Nitrolancea sp.]|nr:ABC transporter permease [Nitrolancea sp.]